MDLNLFWPCPLKMWILYTETNIYCWKMWKNTRKITFASPKMSGGPRCWGRQGISYHSQSQGRPCSDCCGLKLLSARLWFCPCHPIYDVLQTILKILLPFLSLLLHPSLCFCLFSLLPKEANMQLCKIP